MLPRTGMAPSLSSYGDYQSLVNLLGKVGAIPVDGDSGDADATKIWWDIRPHPKFGTLEVRIADICTRVEEAVCIAAIIQSVVALLFKLRRENKSWKIYPSYLINENKWRAMRYGITGKLIDFGTEAEVPMEFLAIELMELLEESAKEQGCWDEVAYIETILREGTSADRQLRIFEHALGAGKSEPAAFKDVVENLIDETVEGL